MNCIVIAGGRLDASRTRTWHQRFFSLLKTADLIIAADSGARHLKGSGYLPHVIIGDMDSIDPDSLAFFQTNNVVIQSHPRRKNQTDLELCIGYAKKQGAQKITILGATGTRMDHSLASILLLLPLAKAGISARIMDSNNEIHVVTDRLVMTGTPGDLVSLIPVTSSVRGVTLQGLSYPLEDHTLEMGSTLGISNCFCASSAQIQIRSGMLLVIRSMD